MALHFYLPRCGEEVGYGEEVGCGDEACHVVVGGGRGGGIRVM